MPFLPESHEELQAWLRENPPTSIRIGMDVSLEKMNRVTLYEPEEMIVQCEAGITIEALDDLLAKNNQWIPTLVHGELSQRTLGAAIARDPYAPRRFDPFRSSSVL